MDMEDTHDTDTTVEFFEWANGESPYGG
jgi:hypothetical protein